jgi:Flp pilus assembly protein TadB
MSVLRPALSTITPAVNAAAATNGPALLLTALVAATAVALLMPGRPGPRRLIKRPALLSRLGLVSERFSARSVSPSARRLHRLTAGAVAVGTLLLFGLPVGLLLAPPAFICIPIALSRLEPAAARQRHARITADLPLVVDLLAACLRAGRPPQSAVGTVAKAINGPLAELLAQLDHRLSLGTDPIEAWSCLLSEPACSSFARAVQRALRSGAPLAKSLEHLADDARQARRWTADEQARAVESRAVVPLGLCFLPAFVFLGIVPTVAGSLGGIVSLFA